MKENKKYFERILEQESRIQSLVLEIRKKEWGLPGDRDTLEEFAEKLNQVNTKKKIICDENERLKKELNTLKHQKMRDDKENNDMIVKLRDELSFYENSESRSQNDEQLSMLKEEIEKKNAVIKSLKETQVKFIEQFQMLQESVGKSFIVKDQEIKISRETEVRMEYAESPVKVKSTSDYDIKISSTESPSTLNSSPTDNNSKEESSTFMNLPIIHSTLPLIDSHKDTFNDKDDSPTDDDTSTDNESASLSQAVDENVSAPEIPVTSTKSTDNESASLSEAVDENVSAPEIPVTSTKSYNSSKKTHDLYAKNFESFITEDKRFKCPIPDCKSISKFPNIGGLKTHITAHFSKLITQKYPFNYKSPKPCVICKKSSIKLSSSHGHFYHYGMTHRELLTLVPDSDHRKQYILPFF